MSTVQVPGKAGLPEKPPGLRTPKVLTVLKRMLGNSSALGGRGGRQECYLTPFLRLKAHGRLETQHTHMTF